MTKSSKSRLEMLEEFTQQSPTDAFAHYGLAIEYKNAERHDDALQVFEKLLSFNPDYTAAYYHAGVMLGGMNRKDDARDYLTRGIAVAKKNGDFHTLSELEEALNDLG